MKKLARSEKSIMPEARRIFKSGCLLSISSKVASWEEARRIDRPDVVLTNRAMAEYGKFSLRITERGYSNEMVPKDGKVPDILFYEGKALFSQEGPVELSVLCDSRKEFWFNRDRGTFYAHMDLENGLESVLESAKSLSAILVRESGNGSLVTAMEYKTSLNRLWGSIDEMKEDPSLEDTVKSMQGQVKILLGKITEILGPIIRSEEYRSVMLGIIDR